MKELLQDIRTELDELLRHPVAAALFTVLLLHALGVPVSRPTAALHALQHVAAAQAGQQAHRVKDRLKQHRSPLQVCADLLP